MPACSSPQRYSNRRQRSGPNPVRQIRSRAHLRRQTLHHGGVQPLRLQTKIRTTIRNSKCNNPEQHIQPLSVQLRQPTGFWPLPLVAGPHPPAPFPQRAGADTHERSGAGELTVKTEENKANTHGPIITTKSNNRDYGQSKTANQSNNTKRRRGRSRSGTQKRRRRFQKQQQRRQRGEHGHGNSNGR